MYFIQTRVILSLTACLFLFFTNAQTTINYNKAWSEIDALIEDAQPLKAIAKLNLLSSSIQKNKEEDQWIKCQVYYLALQHQETDSLQSKALTNFKTAINNAPSKQAKAILSVLLAKKMIAIFNSNQERISERKMFTGIDSNNIQYWTKKDFQKQTYSLYRTVLSDSILLKKTNVVKYPALIEKSTSASSGQSLYSYLLKEIITDSKAWCKIEEINANNQANVFSILPLNNFLAVTIKENDIPLHWYTILKSYQILLLNDLNAHSLKSLVLTDLDRIDFYKNQTLNTQQKENVEKSLEYLQEIYTSEPASIKAAEMLFRILWDDTKKTYSSDRNEQKLYTYNKRKFLKHVERIKQLYPAKLIDKIDISTSLEYFEKKRLGYIQVEQINQPNKPFRIMAEYEYIDTIYVRSVKIDPALLYSRRKNYNDSIILNYWEEISKAQPINTEQFVLPKNFGSVEIKVDSLPQGSYIILVSNKASFNYKEDLICASYTTVSPFYFFSRGNIFYVRDYQTGKPIINATVEASNQSGIKQFVNTNEYGEFNLADIKQIKDDGFFIKIKKGTDSLVYAYKLEVNIDRKQNEIKDNPIKHRLDIFKDKPVYKPGQEVLFQGIVMIKKADDLKYQLNTMGKSIRLYLKNGINKTIDSILVQSNEFGSITGKFILPATIAAGDYKITGNFNEINNEEIEVAKYQLYDVNKNSSGLKISFEENEKVYRLNDTVNIKGSLTSIAGNPIKNMVITYKIFSALHFIESPQLKMNIHTPDWKLGTATTDANGHFNIKFITEATDTSVSIYYIINVKAEKKSGEFVQGAFEVNATDQNIELILEAPEILPIDAWEKALNITTKSRIGLAKPKATISFTWHKIQTENRILRKRQWSTPNVFLYSKADFVRFFPNDEYLKETDISTLPSTTIQGNPTEPGLYKLMVTAADSLHQSDMKHKYLFLYDEKTIDDPFLFGKSTILNNKNKESVAWRSFDANQDLFIRRDWLIANSNLSSQYLFSSHEKNWNELKIVENDQKTIANQDVFVWQGNLYQKKNLFREKKNADDLKINYTSFRNKTSTGSKETWKVAVSGVNKDVKNIELFSSLYDENLNEINPQDNWYIWSNGSESDQSLPSYYDRLEKPELVDDSYYGYRYQQEQKQLHIRLAENSEEMQPDNDDPFNESKAIIMNEQLVEILIKTNAYEPKKESGPWEQRYIPASDPAIYISSNKSFITKRKNEKETIVKDLAFFIPQIHADSNGLFNINFEVPDVATTWTWKTIAYSKDLSYGKINTTISTQKQFIVAANFPSMISSGKQITLEATITNLGFETTNGNVKISFLDVDTGKPLDVSIDSNFIQQSLTIEAGKTMEVKFPIRIPANYSKKIKCIIIAEAGNYSDGEEQIIYVDSKKQ